MAVFHMLFVGSVSSNRAHTGVITYVNSNSTLLAHRPHHEPFHLLPLEWQVRSRLQTYKAVLTSCHQYLAVLLHHCKL